MGLGKSRVNRRSFVRLLSLGGGAALLAACQQPQPAAPAAAPAKPAAQPTSPPAKPAAAAKAPAQAAAPGAALKDVKVNIPQDLVEAAKKEGQLVFYGPAGQEAYDTIFAEFTKQYPEIKVTATRVPTSGLLERVLTEFKTGRQQADVVHASTETAEFVQAGAVERVTVPEEKTVSRFPSPPEIPAVADSVLTKHVIYNSAMLKPEELPKTWMDLTDPKWKGKVAVETSAYEWYYAMKRSMSPDQFQAFMTGLAKNAVLHEGSTATMELMVAGEFPLYVEAYGHRYVQFKNEGAPLEVIRPQFEPIAVMPTYWSAMKNAPHPNAAKLALHWVLTDAGQRAQLKANRMPVVKEMADNPYEPLLAGVETYVIHAGQLDYTEIAKEFNQIFGL